jgi:phosphate/sulfate permease
MTKIFTALLAVAFIVMKIMNIIDWDWIWVLSPIWGYVACCMFLVVVYAAVKVSEENKSSSIRGKSKWQERMEQMQKDGSIRRKATQDN